MKHFKSLDGLRAVSVAIVLCAHLAHSDTLPASLDAILGHVDGALGVRVFFVISGFLITYLLIAERARNGRVSLRDFYLRRSLRIMPAYYAFILAVAAIDGFGTMHLHACNYLTSVLYLKNYACPTWIDGHLWSLAVEQQFYLLWPLVIAFAPPRLAIAIGVAVVGLAPVTRMIEFSGGGRQFFWLTSNADALMFGAAGAALTFFRPAVIKRLTAPRWLAPVVAGLAIVALVAAERREILPGLSVTLGETVQCACILYLMLYVIQNSEGFAGRVLNLRPLQFCGALSYSLYIWQEIFLTKDRYGLFIDHLLWFPANILAAGGMALASYFLLERPVARLRAALRPTAPQPDGAGRSRMTFEDVKTLASAWPGVAEGTSYGTAALKVNGKLLARLKEDGDSLVVAGIGHEERAMLMEARPHVFYITDHYRDWPAVLVRLSRVEPPVVERLLLRRWRSIAPTKLLRSWEAAHGTAV